MRFAMAFVAATALFASGCREHAYAYSYHKADVSDEQLLRDQQTLLNAAGVNRVVGTRHDDGSATIEVDVDGEDRIELQRKLSLLGYTRGRH